MGSYRTQEACRRSVERDGMDIPAMPSARATHEPSLSSSLGHPVSVPIATPLQRLVTTALAAEDAVDYEAEEYTLHRAECAAIDARVALREYLASQGLSVEEINRMGECL